MDTSLLFNLDSTNKYKLLIFTQRHKEHEWQKHYHLFLYFTLLVIFAA